MFPIIILTASLSLLVSHMYLPAMPLIADGFSVPVAWVQSSVVLSLLSFCGSQLFFGTISDYRGRRPMLLTGTFFLLIGSLLCALGPSIGLFLLGRSIQGIGAAAMMTLARSMMRDSFEESRFSQLSAWVALLLAFTLSAAPVLGGSISHFAGWRAIFYALAASALGLMFILRRLPETNLHIKEHAPSVASIMKDWGSILKNRAFLGYTISISCAWSGITAYSTMSPFYFESRFGMNVQETGWILFAGTSGVILGRLANTFLVSRVRPQVLVLSGSIILLVAGSSMFLQTLWTPLSVFSIVSPIFIFIFGSGFILSGAMVGALAPFKKECGSAAALHGAIQVLASALGSLLATIGLVSTQYSLSILLTVLGGMACLASSVKENSST